ncbi:fungal-specific transcription factor domain-containing protein [Mycena polygramma]|nr:fungal-specific transcription factor domain-containing protein [Mycena polygramma]
MSSNGVTFVDEDGLKKRACDMCRRKKRRCDGGERCTHCRKRDLTCTYLEPAAVRLVAAHRSNLEEAYDSDYVVNLKLRLQEAEASLRELSYREPPLFVKTIRGLVKPFAPSHPDDAAFLDIADSFRTLSIGSPVPDPGFQGKSSAAMLVTAVVTVRSGAETPEPRRGRHGNRTTPKPWTLKPWELAVQEHDLSFPEEHLMTLLVSLYFSNVNAFLPLLHRPMFEQCMGERLYAHDLRFGKVVLLVCALGSLYLDDPSLRGGREQLAWRWYDQVELCGHLLRKQPTLSDIQAYCLAVNFLQRTSNPRFAWSLAGFGLRLAQDIGVHRRNTRSSQTTPDEELQRRAFWILMILDAQLSGMLGRSAVLDAVEADIGMPCDYDDEYWQPSGPGRQPEGKPSVLAFFICLINLYRLLHFILRSSYTIRANHIRTGTLDSLAKIVVEYDAALDKWFSSIPKHRTWSPFLYSLPGREQPDMLFFEQSAVLHCFYYYVRILAHRPFIPAVHSMMEPNPDALGICTEAARACIQVADIHRRRRPNNPLLFSQIAVFTAAMILLLDEWSPSPERCSPEEDTELIHASIDILKTQQERWPSCGFFITVLERLLSVDSNAQFPGLEDASYIGHSEHPTIRVPEASGHPVLNDASATGTRPSHFPHETHPQMAIPPIFVGDEEIRPRRILCAPRTLDSTTRVLTMLLASA